MSTFTLAISCLTTSNLPLFMDLTFQVPMQYCSYSIGSCFYHQSHPQLGIVFALAPSLHSFWSYFFWSPVAYWAPNDLGSSSFCILSFCLENPMNSMKRQKDRTLKDELPRSVGALYVTGDQWRNNSRKNEETEPKWKQSLVLDVTDDGSKVRCCKE